jgi:hypothetical protein
MDAFAKDYGQSSLNGVLNQYGVGAATFGGSIQVAGPEGTVTDADINRIVKAAVSSPALKSDPQAIYTVILGPLTDNLTAFGRSAGGYHYTFTKPDGSRGYLAAVTWYSSTPYQTPVTALMVPTSHEWTEARTDPVFDLKTGGTAWTGVTGGGVTGELEDLTEDSTIDNYQCDAAGYPIEATWSRADKAFEIARNSPPGVPDYPQLTGQASALQRGKSQA